MSARTAPDWERIQAQYAAGTMSTREIAAEHCISHTAINKRARIHGWERSLRDQINARAEAKLSRATVAAELGEVSNGEVSTRVSAGSRHAEKVVIEVESEVRARVKLAHRSDIRRARDLGRRLFEELEAQSIDPALLAQFGECMRSPNDQGADRLNDLYLKVISLPSRADTAKKLIEVMRMSVALEREAYSMDAPGAEAPAESALDRWMREMVEGKRTFGTLQVVKEVPSDDE